jgi:hypothetical protein
MLSCSGSDSIDFNRVDSRLGYIHCSEVKVGGPDALSIERHRSHTTRLKTLPRKDVYLEAGSTISVIMRELMKATPIHLP